MIIIKKNIMIMIYIKVKLLRLVRNISGLHTQILCKMDLDGHFFDHYFSNPI